jgi:uncharacterized membrane protein YhhN
VTPAAAAAFALAAVFAGGDWWSRARGRKDVEYVCKPATLALLVVAATALDPSVGGDTRRSWFVAALAFSLAGDVLLMLPSDRFVAGLAAFLVAHVCYIAGFWTDPPAATAVALAAAVVAPPVALVAVPVLRALRGDPRMRAPVAAYIGVISAMVVSAVAAGNVPGAAGAALFAGSDGLIAWDRFVRPTAWAAVTIMVTYHLGQALLVLSLLA